MLNIYNFLFLYLCLAIIKQLDCYVLRTFECTYELETIYPLSTFEFWHKCFNKSWVLCPTGLSHEVPGLNLSCSASGTHPLDLTVNEYVGHYLHGGRKGGEEKTWKNLYESYAMTIIFIYN